MMKHYIYVPGLGDGFDPLRRIALLLWRSKNTRATLVPMQWRHQTETYEQKYDRVAEAISNAHGDKIILVGESAGGAMALLTFYRHQKEVSQTVTICGYNTGANDIHPWYRRRNPALYPLSATLESVIKKVTDDVLQRITTIYSLYDTSVAPKYSRVGGTKEQILRVPGHFTTIAYVLIRGVKRIA